MDRSLLTAFLAAIALAASPLAAQRLTFSLNGNVADSAELFSPAFEAEVNQRTDEIERQTDISVAVVSMPTLAGKESGKVAHKIGETFRETGQLKENWVVFLLAPNEREFSAAITAKTDLPAGASESAQQTEISNRVEAFAQEFSAAVTPYFKDNQWEAGILAGIDALEDNIESAESEAPAPTKAIS